MARGLFSVALLVATSGCLSATLPPLEDLEPSLPGMPQEYLAAFPALRCRDGAGQKLFAPDWQTSLDACNFEMTPSEHRERGHHRGQSEQSPQHRRGRQGLHPAGRRRLRLGRHLHDS